MTYNVFGGTLNPAQSQSHPDRVQRAVKWLCVFHWKFHFTSLLRMTQSNGGGSRYWSSSDTKHHSSVDVYWRMWRLTQQSFGQWYLAVDVLKCISDVSDAEVRIEYKLESGRRLIEVQFVLARTETKQALNTATHQHTCIFTINLASVSQSVSQSINQSINQFIYESVIATTDIIIKYKVIKNKTNKSIKKWQSYGHDEGSNLFWLTVY